MLSQALRQNVMPFNIKKVHPIRMNLQLVLLKNLRKFISGMFIKPFKSGIVS